VRVHVASAWGGGRAHEELLASAARDRFGVHTLTDDAHAADVVLFAEMVHFDDPEWRKVLGHPLMQRYREKCFLYNEADEPWCVMPGLYCSMPRRSFQPRRQRAFSYLYTLNDKLEGPSDHERRWLYSFIGAANHDARRRLLRLNDARALLEDTSLFNMWKMPDPAEKERRTRRYAEVMAASLFVICPRGAGTSSYRLYESMMMGIAPVLVSDEWVAPDGPDWGAFLLKVREADVAELPRILRSHERQAIARGIRARKAWEQWFSPEVRFHRAAEACRELLALRLVPESVARLLPSVEHQRSRVRRWLHQGKAYVRERLNG
jgi:hypothetical protein